MSWASRCTERCHEAEGALRDVMGLEMSLREGARLTRVCATHRARYSRAQPSACACGFARASRIKRLTRVCATHRALYSRAQPSACTTTTTLASDWSSSHAAHDDIFITTLASDSSSMIFSLLHWQATGARAMQPMTIFALLHWQATQAR